MYPGVQPATTAGNQPYVYGQQSPEPGQVPVAQPVIYYAQQPMQYSPQPMAYGQPAPGGPIYAAQPVAYAQPGGAPMVYGSPGQPGPGQTIIVQGGGAMPLMAGPSIWRTELFDCCEEPGIFIMSLLFPCGTVGQNEEMKSGPNGVGCFCSGLTACAVFTLCAMIPFLTPIWPCYLGSQRSSTRAQYNIQGDSCTDCLCHVVCSPCALTQEYIEIKKRNNELRGGPPAMHMQ